MHNTWLSYVSCFYSVLCIFTKPRRFIILRVWVWVKPRTKPIPTLHTPYTHPLNINCDSLGSNCGIPYCGLVATTIVYVTKRNTYMYYRLTQETWRRKRENRKDGYLLEYSFTCEKRNKHGFILPYAIMNRKQ